MPLRVLVTALSSKRSSKALEMFRSKGYEIILSPYDRALHEQELLPLIENVDAAVVGNDAVTKDVIAAGLPSLRIIAKCGAGFDNIDIAAARECGIPVTNTPGANSKSVADLTIGLMLSLARNIPQLNQGLHSGAWNKFTGIELAGKILGVIGTGNVAREVIRRAKSFDMNVIAYNVRPNQQLAEQYGFSFMPLSDVISKADFLSLHLPISPETIGMISKTTLKEMKPSAFLINTARGELVVEEDLCEALRQGIIAGAALDTFAREPLQDSCLCSMPDVILTPHTGANTYEAAARVSTMAAEEVIRVLSGSLPQHVVN
jgi:D-3-phosphoglycerate dehydrogenase